MGIRSRLLGAIDSFIVSSTEVGKAFVRETVRLVSQIADSTSAALLTIVNHNVYYAARRNRIHTGPEYRPEVHPHKASGFARLFDGSDADGVDEVSPLRGRADSCDSTTAEYEYAPENPDPKTSNTKAIKRHRSSDSDATTMTWFEQPLKQKVSSVVKRAVKFSINASLTSARLVVMWIPGMGVRAERLAKALQVSKKMPEHAVMQLEGDRQGLLSEVQMRVMVGLEWVSWRARRFVGFILGGKNAASESGVPLNTSLREFRSQNVRRKGNFSDLVKKAGYPFKQYIVHTDDGYLLELHRLPRPESRNVMFLQHGVMDSSYSFIANGASDGLAFRAFDKGYDVFMGNFRGTSSLKHVQANISAKDYWDYTLDDHGNYDITAFIRFIRHMKFEEMRVSPQQGPNSGKPAPDLGQHDLPKPPESQPPNKGTPSAADNGGTPPAVRFADKLSSVTGEEKQGEGAQAEDNMRSRVGTDNKKEVGGEGAPEAGRAAQNRKKKKGKKGPTKQGGADEEVLAVSPDTRPNDRPPEGPPGGQTLKLDVSGHSEGKESAEAGSPQKGDDKVSVWGKVDKEEDFEVDITAVAHSMGAASTLLYMVNKLRKKESHHLSRIVLMSPAGYHRRIPRLCKLTGPILYHTLANWTYTLSIPSARARNLGTRIFTDAVSLPAMRDVIYSFGEMFLGGDFKETLHSHINVVTDNMIAGTSSQVFKQFWTCYLKGKFLSYDYGSVGNQRAYGSDQPLDYFSLYHLIDVPCHFIAGLNDNLIPAKDALKHYKVLHRFHPELATCMPFAGKGHIDFTYGLDREISHQIFSHAGPAGCRTASSPRPGLHRQPWSSPLPSQRPTARPSPIKRPQSVSERLGPGASPGTSPFLGADNLRQRHSDVLAGVSPGSSDLYGDGGGRDENDAWC